MFIFVVRTINEVSFLVSLNPQVSTKDKVII